MGGDGGGLPRPGDYLNYGIGTWSYMFKAILTIGIGIGCGHDIAIFLELHLPAFDGVVNSIPSAIFVNIVELGTGDSCPAGWDITEGV